MCNVQAIKIDESCTLFLSEQFWILVTEVSNASKFGVPEVITKLALHLFLDLGIDRKEIQILAELLVFD